MSYWFLENKKNENWAYCSTFTKEHCRDIIDIGKQLQPKDATVFDSENKPSVDDSFRVSKISWIYPNKDTSWIFQRCTDVIHQVNRQFFNFDLQFIEGLQFTEYSSTNINSFYDKHIDTLYDSGITRKMSFSIELCSPDEYEGGDLVFYFSKNEEAAYKQIGMGNFFPSWTLHEVKPLTKGTRYSLVGWVCGPSFR
jgi:PKHD-type hydroxylase